MVNVDIAREFAACVQSIGGRVLDDEIKNPTFRNADYWFPDHSTVAELKCLQDDLASKPDWRQMTSRLYASWVRRGLIRPRRVRPIRLQLRSIPRVCADEFLELVKRRIESSTIRAANRQIRETKAFLGAADAKGLLLLANDGNLMLKPDMMAHLLARILTGKHSSVDSVIYFTVNHTVSVPGVQGPSLFWIDARVPNREPVPDELRLRLREAWIAHHAALTGTPVDTVLMPNDPEAVEQIIFDP